MGWAKNRQIEQDEAGYSLNLSREVLGGVPDCISDDGLRRFVASHVQIDRCDYCDGPGPHGLGLGALFDYMARCLEGEWDLAINELRYGDGDELWESGGATVYDGYDLLGEVGDPVANPELCFGHHGRAETGYRGDADERGSPGQSMNAVCGQQDGGKSDGNWGPTRPTWDGGCECS